jgi:hypothetical protein
VEYRWRQYRGFGAFGDFGGQYRRLTSHCDFPIRKSPIKGSVDPLTIGDRGFVLHVNCVRVNRELPSRDIPISEEGDCRRIIVGDS